jgi:hypothetical protein
MNTRFAVAKSRRVAKALNRSGGHAKSAEKGHIIPKKIGGVDNRKLPRISSVVH